MAQRAIDGELSEQIDWCLTYLIDQWGDLPAQAERWSALDWTEQEVFHLEWAGITEHWLRELYHWARAGLLAPDQLRRYRQIEQLVREQRPTLRAMLGAETALTPTIVESDER